MVDTHVHAHTTYFLSDEMARGNEAIPAFPLPKGETEESYFRKQVQKGLERRYGNPVPQKAQERANYEMDVIIRQGFSALFLIVQEYTDWARSQGIVMGPGRGSEVGSIVSYALGITNVEPLSNGLLFERFMVPEHTEMPDIFIEIDEERRGEVVDHIKDVYGEDHVAGIVMSDDAVGLQVRGGESVISHIIDGYLRNEDINPCTVVISRDSLSDHAFAKRDAEGSIVVMPKNDDVSDLSLLKLNFLGSPALTTIARACKNINESTGVKLAFKEIPAHDPQAFELLRSSDTEGLFQIGSEAYITLFKQLPPQRFSDIVAAIAMNRPGPMGSGMLDKYIETASGKTSVGHYDERLRSILEETYGMVIYQEQIMQIAMTMCGFSADKANKLRKAIARKQHDVMQELQEDWNSGAVANGFSLKTANQIWNDMAKFAPYIYCKAHAVGMATLEMRTAYLKAHYPDEYMAAANEVANAHKH